jgi:hypothetical protein
MNEVGNGKMNNQRAGEQYQRPAGPALLLCITVALAIVPAAAGPVITNGSFTTTTVASWNTVPSFDIGVVGTKESNSTGSGSISGWSMVTPSLGYLNCLVSGGATSYMCGNANNINNNLILWTNPGVSPDGGNYVMLDGDPNYGSGIQQTVANLKVGQEYAITFYQAAGEQTGFGNAGATANVNWGICFSNATCTTANASVAPTMSFLEDGTSAVTAWNKVTINFTATTVSQTLTFLAEGPTGAPPFLMLDGVSITAAPEPATMGLIGLGLIAFPLAHRWMMKRKKTRGLLTPY